MHQFGLIADGKQANACTHMHCMHSKRKQGLVLNNGK